MIDLLAVGHTARDEFPDGSWRLGGSALYGAVTASRLGARVALVTRVGPGERDALDERCRRERIELVALPSNTTTTFAFRYDPDGHRTLRLRSRARGIALADIAGRLRISRAAILGSIAHELSRDVFAGLRAPVSVLIAQGYLRSWEADGTIRPRDWSEAHEVLPHVTAAVVSEEDIAGHERVVERWTEHTTLVVTHAERGATVHPKDGPPVDVPAFGADAVVDPTGAGDAFAAAFAVALADGRDPREAARFANAAASFAVEGPGTDALADRGRVEARLSGG
ncbi:MAG TPA: PfkB family carbohydrate kinase [Candidatus Limnocylindria bacterium]|nr:PfkB family carbohydrate kinase [Candidatus Limnocylindria bacterium]